MNTLMTKNYLELLKIKWQTDLNAQLSWIIIK